MEFCPICGNMLRYDRPRFFCSTCPYIACIDRQVYSLLLIENENQNPLLRVFIAKSLHLSSCFLDFVLFCFVEQVEIKKKQLLVKKSIEAVVTKEDIPTGAETESSLNLYGYSLV